MSRAVKCDSCGKLTEVHKSITLEVRVPDPEKPGEYHPWSDVDICSTCFNWTLSEVLGHACNGIELPRGDEIDRICPKE